MKTWSMKYECMIVISCNIVWIICGAHAHSRSHVPCDRSRARAHGANAVKRIMTVPCLVSRQTTYGRRFDVTCERGAGLARFGSPGDGRRTLRAQIRDGRRSEPHLWGVGWIGWSTVAPPRRINERENVYTSNVSLGAHCPPVNRQPERGKIPRRARPTITTNSCCNAAGEPLPSPRFITIASTAREVDCPNPNSNNCFVCGGCWLGRCATILQHC